MLLLQSRVPSIQAITSNGEFPDVREGSWYERYVVVGERLGILQADPFTRRIRPDDPVTRAEFVTMAAKAFGVDPSIFPTRYRDVPTDAWYAHAAGMALRLRLFPGDADQTLLRPDAFLIHGEVAKAVRLLGEAIAGPWKNVVTRPAFGVDALENISTSTQHIAFVKARGMSQAIAPRRQTADPAQAPRLREEVLRLVNAERTKAGLNLLRVNGPLEGSAQRYAREMAQGAFFGHISPAGETLRERMEGSGYYRMFFQSDCFCIARFILGENLARGQKTPAEAVRDWLLSPGHRAAMLNPDFTDTGIGIVAGIWVEHFGGKQK